jgi:hypothetical protein
MKGQRERAYHPGVKCSWLSVAPTMGIYSASKWAVEAINESMAGEVKGIRDTYNLNRT